MLIRIAASHDPLAQDEIMLLRIVESIGSQESPRYDTEILQLEMLVADEPVSYTHLTLPTKA